MKTYLLPESLRNDLLAYLHEQPFKSVAAGVGRLMALEEAPIPASSTGSADAETPRANDANSRQ